MQPQRQSRAAPLPRFLTVAGVVVAAAVAAALAVAFTGSSGSSVTLRAMIPNQAALPGLDHRSAAVAGRARAARRAARDARAATAADGERGHPHPPASRPLRERPPPHRAALIGINPQQDYLDPLHTHDSSGIIRVESPTKTEFTLGQFFAVWGARLTRTCIGGPCAGNGRVLRAWMDGTARPSRPGRIVLKAHRETVLAYGTAAQLPRKIPSSYSFPPGL